MSSDPNGESGATFIFTVAVIAISWIIWMPLGVFLLGFLIGGVIIVFAYQKEHESEHNRNDNWNRRHRDRD